MAKQRVLRNIEDAFANVFERLRKLELRQNRIGSWTLVEDQATGNLMAVRNNGSGVPKTVVTLGVK